jgi:hypothetical protein
VSRVADGKAKLTVALDGARAQWRPRNRRWTSVGGGGGSRFAWAERERGRESWAEGTNGRGEVGEQGAGFKRGAGTWMWPENAQTWVRPRRGIMGERLGTTDRWGQQDREGNEHAGERNSTDRPGKRDRERDRGGAQGCADRRDPPVRQRGRAGARARTGLSGLPWTEIGFPFSR